MTIDENIRQQAASMLNWYLVSGVDVMVSSKPINYFELKNNSPINNTPPSNNLGLNNNSSLGEHSGKQAVVKSDANDYHSQVYSDNDYYSQPKSPSSAGSSQQLSSDIITAKTIAAKAKTIDELQQAIASFELCNLKKIAKHTLLGIGNRCAKILIVGDVPTAHDDNIGKLFSGEAGELLQKMLAAINLDLYNDCFATSLSPWITMAERMLPNNEVAMLKPFLERLVELMQPKIIISLGAIPASALLGKNININDLRVKPNLHHNLTIFTTYHPNILLKNPTLKRNTWQDLLAVKAYLEQSNIA